MFVVAFVQSIALQQYFHVIFRLGMNVRTAVIGMVYSKVRDDDNCIIKFDLKSSAPVID